MNAASNDFPNAPHGWDTHVAEAIAQQDGLTLKEDHWELIRALQEYYRKVEFPKLRQVKDALDERFRSELEALGIEVLVAGAGGENEVAAPTGLQALGGE